MEGGAGFRNGKLVGFARVIESGPAIHAKSHRAAHHGNEPDQPMLFRMFGSVRDRHEVGNLSHAVGRQMASDQDVGVGPIELLVVDAFSFGADAKPAALLVIEKGAKNAGGVKSRKAEPVDGTFAADQCRGSEVADNPVVLNGFVGHEGSGRRQTGCRKALLVAQIYY